MEIFKIFFNQQPLWDHLYSVSYFSGSKWQGKALLLLRWLCIYKQSLHRSLQSLYFSHNKLGSLYNTRSNIDSVKLPQMMPHCLCPPHQLLQAECHHGQSVYLSDSSSLEEQRASHSLKHSRSKLGTPPTGCRITISFNILSSGPQLKAQ